MKIDVTMPKLGESLTEGTVIKWLKKTGESVQKDETLLEVSTDKVDSEIPSPVDGILVEILAEENQTVEVNSVIARVETSGATADAESRQPEKIQNSEAEPAPASDDGPEAAPDSQGKAEGVIDVKMPKMGESLTEGTVLKWFKNAGDTVQKDETLLEISTDKVDSEIPSPVSGTVVETVVKENETVEVGTTIARISTSEKQVASVAETKKETEHLTSAGSRQEPPLQTDAAAEGAGQAEELVRRAGHRFYSPLVMTIARKEDVSMEELEQISGSGSSGRVTKKDVLRYIQNRPAEGVTKAAATRPSQPAASAAPAMAGTLRSEVVPLDPVLKSMATHMRKSLDTSAHVYSVSECDMTALLGVMYKNRPRFEEEEGFKLTVTPFILQAVVQALGEFPRINSSLDGENLVYKKNINLGIAVASPKGLIVPVLKNADEKNLRGLARSLNDLVERARSNKLTLDDISGSTFSITNYGIFGNIIGLPIINQPNLAILGIGAIKKRPVVIESYAGDSIAIRSMTYISMSYDHRVIDGEMGGRFMQRLVHYLENIREDSL